MSIAATASPVIAAARPIAPRTFVVERRDLGNACWRDASVPPDLAPGEVLLRHDRFALTANNITYAKLGDAIDYWRYFPVAAPWGQVPVWGLGHVARSRHPELAEGERVYGYFPMATHLLVTAGRIKPTGFTDASAHRADLPVTYNEYSRLDRDPGYDPARADQHLVLRPLFALSFFLAEFLKTEALCGTRRVFISSASSKAAMGLAFLLAQAKPHDVRLVGLTSAGNARAGHYDDVVTYDAIASVDNHAPAIFADIAGDARVRRALHERLGDTLHYSGCVGVTHGDGAEVDETLPGAKPQWFFTPSEILRRREQWGPALLRERLGIAWRAFLADTDRWLRIGHGAGEDAIAAAYRDVRDGRVPPDLAHTLAFG